MFSLDLPSIKDFIAEHILGSYAGGDLPQKVDLYNLDHTHNQGYTNKCTAYALTHCFEILNTLDLKIKVKADPDEQWENQKKFPATADDSVGDYLQSALESLRKFGFNIYNKNYTIDGYARIDKSVLSIKQWLSRGFPVYTGATINSGIDSNARNTGVYDFNLTGNEYGHCFLIVGYDDISENFILLNSYGDQYGLKGKVLLPYKNVNKLFTPYVIYDTDDKPVEQQIFKDITSKSPCYSEIVWAKENGIVKGYEDGTFLPDKPLTRAEACVIVKRLYDLLNNK